MTEISPDKLSRYIENEDDIVILDIRHRDEYEEWHIPKSENIDIYDELKEDSEKTKKELKKLPKDKEIITVCTAGKISQKATEVLQNTGHKASTLTDGMKGWSRVHRHSPLSVNLDGNLIQITRPGKGCLSYILISDGKAAVFDPSYYIEEYEKIIEENKADIIGVFDTHAQADHVSGAKKLAEKYSVPYYLHPKETSNMDIKPLEDNQKITIGNVKIEVIHTPGHSPGSVTYNIYNKALITGDTLFHESVGRVELGVEAGLQDTNVEENAENIYESLQKLLNIKGDPLILPSHNPGSPYPPVSKKLSEVIDQNKDLKLKREEFIDKLSSEIPEQPPNFKRVKRVNIGLESINKEEIEDIEIGPNRCAAE